MSLSLHENPPLSPATPVSHVPVNDAGRGVPVEANEGLWELMPESMTPTTTPLPAPLVLLLPPTRRHSPRGPVRTEEPRRVHRVGLADVVLNHRSHTCTTGQGARLPRGQLRSEAVETGRVVVVGLRTDGVGHRVLLPAQVCGVAARVGGVRVERLGTGRCRGVEATNSPAVGRGRGTVHQNDVATGRERRHGSRVCGPARCCASRHGRDQAGGDDAGDCGGGDDTTADTRVCTCVGQGVSLPREPGSRAETGQASPQRRRP